MDSGFQAGSVDTHIIKILKFFIFANTTGFFIIKAHLRGTLQNFVKNVFYKHALEFQVEYYFASVKWFRTNFTKFHTLMLQLSLLLEGVYSSVVTANIFFKYWPRSVLDVHWNFVFSVVESQKYIVKCRARQVPTFSSRLVNG